MFAFVIWDRLSRRAFGARDPFGQKPLFLLRQGEELVFASELGAIPALAHAPLSLNNVALAVFLAVEGFPAGLTPYRGVVQLQPGWMFHHDLRGEHRSVRYSGAARSGASRVVRDPRELTAELDVILERAVRRSCRADVPLSLLLSGGTDSVAILMYLRRLSLPFPVTAFHFSMDDPKLGETSFAEETAKRAGVELRCIRSTPGIFRALAEELLPRLDQPIADPGFLPKAAVCRAISASHKVALGGDGGDELFYGYLLFRAEGYLRSYEKLPQILRERLIEPAVRSARASSRYMGWSFLAKQFIRGASAVPSRRLAAWMYELYGEPLLKYCADKESAVEALRFLDGYWDSLEDEVHQDERLFRMSFKLQRNYLPQYVLANSDRAAMLHGVELRAPLLDGELAAFANSLPDSAKLADGELKGLLKRVLAGKLPRRVVYRKKVGFTFPVARLLRTELAPLLESVLGPDGLGKHGFLDRAAVGELLQRHQQGENCYKPLWTLFSLAIWLERARAARFSNLFPVSG